MDLRKILSIQKNFEIQENLPDGVLVTGTNATIQWANDVAYNLFNIPEGQFVSKTINDILENKSYEQELTEDLTHVYKLTPLGFSTLQELLELIPGVNLYTLKKLVNKSF